jgi:hypothetical protein
MGNNVIIYGKKFCGKDTKMLLKITHTDMKILSIREFGVENYKLRKHFCTN